MYEFGEKHPLIFEIVLVIAAFLVAAVFMLAGAVLNLHPDLCSSVSRTFAGLLLFVLYFRAFRGNRLFGSLPVFAPALLFPAWNLFYNLSSGMAFGGRIYYIEAVITAIAPAVFEEVLFRGIFLYNLKRKGYPDMACLLLSSILFALVHVTNAAGMDFSLVALQVVYSFVIGMVLAAVYLRTKSLLLVIIAHFLTDFCDSIFTDQPSSASVPQIAIFAVLLAAELAYAIGLTKRESPAE